MRNPLGTLTTTPADPSPEVRERRAVRHVYDTIASYYDRRVGAISDVDKYFVDGERRFILPRVGPTDRVLDLGCGTGRYTTHFLRAGNDTVGLDLSAEMMRQARSRVVPGSARDGWVQAEMANLPFAANTFDVVTCILAAMHLNRGERQRVFAEVGRVLRPGGRLVLTCKNETFERLSHRDRFATVDRTDVFRQRLVFTNLDGGGELEAQWNSFSPVDLRALCASAGLRVTALHGHFLLAAWVPDRILRNAFSNGPFGVLERLLGRIRPFNAWGYHLLLEATRPA